MEDREIITEFLIESAENLGRLDQEMVELEKAPKDAALLASIFRTIHTIKGTCGFLGFTTLEAVTHVAENLLSRLRNGEKELTPEIVTLILSTVDAARTMLANIEETATEGSETFDLLRTQLQAECDRKSLDREIHQGTVAVPVPRPEVKEITVEPELPEPEKTDPEPERMATVKSGSVSESTIRVDVSLLDKLMRLVGELVLTRNQILQVASQDDATSQRLNLITSELQESVMRTRMQPIGVVWNKLPRVVRDLAASCGKQIALEMEGADTEVDKTIIEAIKDPLTHIVRNSCDHGLEAPAARLAQGKPGAGHLVLRAFHEGGRVNIEVSDDGAGINIERVKAKAVERGLIRPEQADRMTERDIANLVFLPGFSTAEKVTNISGRGVGMDVVRTNIEKIGGSIELTSAAGEGTTVKIKIPLTLAIIPGLVIHSGGERFVIPQGSLLELVRLEGDARRRSIETIYGTTVYRRRGDLLPLADLDRMLGLAPVGVDPDVVNIVVLQAEQRQFGLIVDGISDTQEIVVKPLGKQLKGTLCYAGATIMGDGKVALILDVMGVGQMCNVLDSSRSHRSSPNRSDKEAAVTEKQAFLLCKAGPLKRLAIPLALVSRLEELPLSRLERASGRLVVQYREGILPLIPIADCLPEDPEPLRDSDGECPTLQVIVVNNGNRSIGLVVEEILDIVDDRISIVQRSSRAGLLGSAVIGGQITDLIDLQSTIQTNDPDWFELKRERKSSTILIADSSTFSRGLARTAIEMAGYRVLEAATLDDAKEVLSRTHVDALLLGAGMPEDEALKKAMDKRVGCLRPSVDERFDREAMLRSLENLIAALDSGGTAEPDCAPLGAGRQ